MLLTFGHGTASPEQMVSLLKDAGVSMLIDVRTVPASRRHPHVVRAQLQRWLPEAGISYRWDKRLGGLRTPEPDSPDVAFGVDSLRGYAGHMRTAAFLTAVDQVLALASARGTAVMCAESLWWRCHRRLLADFVTAASGVPVRHLMHDGRIEEHRLSPGLRRRADRRDGKRLVALQALHPVASRGPHRESRRGERVRLGQRRADHGDAGEA